MNRPKETLSPPGCARRLAKDWPVGASKEARAVPMMIVSAIVLSLLLCLPGSLTASAYFSTENRGLFHEPSGSPLVPYNRIENPDGPHKGLCPNLMVAAIPSGRPPGGAPDTGGGASGGSAAEEPPRPGARLLDIENEYGGKTVEIIHGVNDPRYQEGFAKEICYFNRKGAIMEKEAYSTDEFAAKRGIARSISLLNSNGKVTEVDVYLTERVSRERGIVRTIGSFDDDGYMVSMEIYLSDETARKKGVVRSVGFFNIRGEVTRIEAYHTGEFMRKKGIAKSIFYYGDNGKIVKREEYDSHGTLVHAE